MKTLCVCKLLPWLQKLGWIDFISTTSKCKKLKGLIVEVNVVGQIELILTLKEHERKNPNETQISHIFQIIESKISEASLSIKFFLQNNLVHSTSMQAISKDPKIKLNRMYFPRDTNVEIINMKQKVQDIIYLEIT